MDTYSPKLKMKFTKIKMCVKSLALRFTVAVVTAFLLLASFPVHAQDNTKEVRVAVERAFQQLRSGDFAALYNYLPADAQRRISPERFASTLARSRGMYELDRLEIESVNVAGDVAVVDSTLFGRVRRPIESEGKVTARQYLVREAGQWRVAVDNRAASNRLRTSNPAFARRYPTRDPRIFIKRDGLWVSIGSMNALRQVLG